MSTALPRTASVRNAARLRRFEDEIAAMTAEDVKAFGSEMRVVQSWLSAYLGKLTVRASTLQAQGQHADARDVAAEAGLAPRDAARAAKRGKAMQQMPEAREALEDGEIGVGHADVLACHADRLPGAKKRRFQDQAEQLVADAIRDGLSVPEFDQRCRDAADRLMGDDGISELEKQRRNSKARTWVDDTTGMTHLTGEWDPIRGEAIRKALKAEIAARVAAGASNITPRQRAQLAAEALHALICGQRISKAESAAVMVLIGYDAMAEGIKTSPDGKQRTAETQGGTPLPVETIRRIACDAGIIPIVLNGQGQPLDVGRERRLATRAQRMALRAQYPTCGMDEGCALRRPVGHPPPDHPTTPGNSTHPRNHPHETAEDRR
jgi:5-methylcytosine-specific restriction protein A